MTMSWSIWDKKKKFGGLLKKIFDFVLRWMNINGEKKRGRRRRLVLKLGRNLGMDPDQIWVG